MTSEAEVAALQARLDASEAAYSNAMKDIRELQAALRSHGLEMVAYGVAAPVKTGVVA